MVGGIDLVGRVLETKSIIPAQVDQTIVIAFYNRKLNFVFLILFTGIYRVIWWW